MKGAWRSWEPAPPPRGWGQQGCGVGGHLPGESLPKRAAVPTVAGPGAAREAGGQGHPANIRGSPGKAEGPRWTSRLRGQGPGEEADLSGGSCPCRSKRQEWKTLPTFPRRRARRAGGGRPPSWWGCMPLSVVQGLCQLPASLWPPPQRPRDSPVGASLSSHRSGAGGPTEATRAPLAGGSLPRTTVACREKAAQV